jgi:hypothetical protein
MKKNIFAGIFAGVLAVGLLLGPSLSGLASTADAQAQQNATQGQPGSKGNPLQLPDYQPTCKIKPVTLIAKEVVVDVAPDNVLHPGGIKYNAMTFNGTIPAPEEGIYVGVDHAMADVVKGGAFAVLAANNSTATDHPINTWVPPKGSPVAAGGNVTAAATTNATAG